MNFRKKYEETDIETNLFQGNLNTHKGDHDSVFAANFDLKTSLKNNWNLSIAMLPDFITDLLISEVSFS